MNLILVLGIGFLVFLHPGPSKLQSFELVLANMSRVRCVGSRGLWILAPWVLPPAPCTTLCCQPWWILQCHHGTSQACPAGCTLSLCTTVIFISSLKPSCEGPPNLVTLNWLIYDQVHVFVFGSINQALSPSSTSILSSGSALVFWCLWLLRLY